MPGDIRIRMYRTGFGDCFLLSFGRTKKLHVLVDFGVHQKGDIGTMATVMDDIEQVTGKKLHLLVATHAHRDHISGFGEFRERFASFTIGEVWLPWTDDPDDAGAVALQRKQLAMYDRLHAHLQAMPAAARKDPLHQAAINALDNMRGNGPAKQALARGFGAGATVRYLRGGQSGLSVGGATTLTMDILGPPRDRKALGRMDPPADQRYLTGDGSVAGAVRPFPALEIRSADSDFATIVGLGQPQLGEDDRKALHQAAEPPVGRLALAMDSIRNNTSLVILFRYRGRALLFPGDAQWGNWQSWIQTDAGRSVLAEVDFLKVAHHGSHNASPVEAVEALRESGLAVMVPTQVEPFPTIPRKPLLAALEARCEGHVAVRSDRVKVQGAPAGPSKGKLPKGFSAGEVWIDYTL